MLHLGRTIDAAALVAGLVFLSSCGGGGGGAPPVPMLGASSFTTNENVALHASLTATDSAAGTLTFAATGQPTSGAVSAFTSAGQFVYTPKPNFTGSDSFGVSVTGPGGGTTAGTVTITVTVDRPPTAADTVVRADPGSNGVVAVDVLASAADPDKDPLTVAISPNTTLVGSASVNADGSVSLAGLAGFKGVTRFDYTVTDPTGKSAAGHAAVFVGADPFRAAFVADATGNGSYEVFLTNFAGAPAAVTNATQGSLRLKGFAVSDDGTTVVYRTQDANDAANTSLWFVRTADPSKPVAIALPAGIRPVPDGAGRDQFIVSADGNWIAVIAGQGGTSALYLVNVAQPAVVSPIMPAGAVFASQPRFTVNSKSVFFLASSVAGGAARSLYLASPASPGVVTLVSAASDPAKSDDVFSYSVAADQSRIAIQANRNGGVGLFSVDPAKLQTEVPLNQALKFGQSIATTGGSTIGLAPGLGGSLNLGRVAYHVQNPPNAPASDIDGVFVADVSATPNPRSIAPFDQVIGLRPDDTAVLYTDGAQVFESVIDSGTPGTTLGVATQGWYDSTGGIVLLQTPLTPGAPLSGGSTLAATVRGSFGVTQQVGTPALAVYYLDVSGFPRAAAALIGEGPAAGAVPGAARLGLVNALAPTAVYPLSTLQSPLQLTSAVSTVVAE